MQSKLSKFQRIILVYIGVTAKSQNKKYIKRKDVTIGIAYILNRNIDNNFSALLSQSIAGLKQRKLVSKRGTMIGLTKEGRETARTIIDRINQRYNDINWDIVNRYYQEPLEYSS